jgi:hypothetical protein
MADILDACRITADNAKAAKHWKIYVRNRSTAANVWLLGHLQLSEL